jgi:hypothetical protein
MWNKIAWLHTLIKSTATCAVKAVTSACIRCVTP